MNRKDEESYLLKDPNKRVGEAKGILAVIFRQFLVIQNVDGWMWDKYMRRYLDDPRNGVPNNSRDRSSARGNLNKELNRDDMTFKVFLKAMNFLGFPKLSLSVSATLHNGKTYTVTAKLRGRGVKIQVEGGDDAPFPEGIGTEEDESLEELITEEHVPTLNQPLPKLDKKPSLVAALRRAYRESDHKQEGSDS